MARISRKGSGPGLQAFNRKFRFSESGIRAGTGAPKVFGAPARLKLEKVGLAISLLIGGAGPGYGRFLLGRSIRCKAKSSGSITFRARSGVLPERDRRCRFAGSSGPDRSCHVQFSRVEWGEIFNLSIRQAMAWQSGNQNVISQLVKGASEFAKLFRAICQTV